MAYRDFIILVIACIYAGFLPYFMFLVLIASAALSAQWTRRGSRHTSAISTPEKRFLIVIPARNEEAGIGTTIQSCLALSYPSSLFEVLVVADNCTDQTSSVAKMAGARVIERFDPSRKSKGQAIAYVLDQLDHCGELAKLDAVLFVDADSTVHPQLLERFALRLEHGDDWIQCYDTVANPRQSWRTRLLAYGFSLINGVMPRGQSALGLSAGLRGNGMCFSTRGLKCVPWTTEGLVEDLEYSWSVRIAGGRIAFESDVAVYATMLSRGGKPAIAQRLRWERGRQALKWTSIGPLWRTKALRWPEKLAASLDLTMPTISFLSCSYLALTLATLVLLPDLYPQTSGLTSLCGYAIGLSWAIATLGLLVYVASPFLLGLVPIGHVATLLYIPYYVVWKALIWFHSRPTTWLPTIRELSTNAATRIRPDDIQDAQTARVDPAHRASRSQS